MRKLIFSALLCFLLAPPVFSETDPLRIGAIFSLSSWGAEGGQSELNAVLMAEEKINSEEGIAGRPVKIIAEDNHSDLKSTATVFRKLLSVDKVTALIGPNWAEFSEIAAPLADQEKIPMISSSGYKEGLFAGRDYAFTLWPPHSVASEPLADYIESQGHRKLSVLITENAYLEGVLSGLRKQLKRRGVSILDTHRFIQGNYDYSSIISRLKSGDSDSVLVLLFEAGELGGFLKQSKQMKLGLPLYTANGVPFSETIKKTPLIAEGLVYYDFITPGTEAFKNEYRKRYRSEPGFASAKAYDSLFLYKAAIEKCGTDSEKIKDCLAGIDFNGLSSRIQFDSNGVLAGVKTNTYLMQVKGGRFIKLRKDSP